MNIFAIKGHKVKVTTDSLQSGEDTTNAHAIKFLKEGNEYTIEKTKVENWHTDVWLQEFPDEVFNSVNFEDVSWQSEEEDKKHPDYKKFN